MSITRCPECNKIISTRFPMHDCVPEEPVMAHIRKPFRRSLRTTNNCAAVQDPAPATLCGSPVTDRDWGFSSVVHAGQLTKAANGFVSNWNGCPFCLEKARTSK
jgi:hypothetical protein